MRGKVKLTVALLLIFGSSYAQNAKFGLNWSLSTPDAGLFFLNPTYLSPVDARGVAGIYANPAALGFVMGKEVAFAIGLSKTTSNSFDLQVYDTTGQMGAGDVSTDFTIKEKGGINYFGIGANLGTFGVGFGVFQGAFSNIELSATGSIASAVKLGIGGVLRRENFLNPPSNLGESDSLLVTWSVDDTLNPRLSSSGEEGGLSASPFLFGLGTSVGPISFGAGLKFIKYNGDIHTSIQAVVEDTLDVTGDVTGGSVNWTGGEISGNLIVEDTVYFSEILLNAKGTRTAFDLGFLFKFGTVGVGLNIERGFGTTLSGDYRYSIISPLDTPGDVTVDSITGDSISGYSIEGKTGEFDKDSTISEEPGDFELPGYWGVSLGLHLPLFNIFGGAQFPGGRPEITKFYAGVYLIPPIPSPNISFRLGSMLVWHGVKPIGSEEGIFETWGYPLRPLLYFGLGSTVKIGIPALTPAPVELDIALKTSGIPIILNMVKDDIEDIENLETAGIFSSLSFNMGLRAHIF